MTKPRTFRPSQADEARVLRRMGAAPFAAILILAAWPTAAATVASAPFGTTRDGRAVVRTKMEAADGVSVSFLNYGGRITDVVAPDRRGYPGHVVLGFPTFLDYETTDAEHELYFGALLGRYANWIARGRFDLDGRKVRLTLSDPPNTIHGGVRGFHKRICTVTPRAPSGPEVAVKLTYVSPNGEEGFPGTLRVTVTYALSDDGALTIHYGAVTDRDTVLNLSSHMSFNLAGAGSPRGVLDQVLTIDADQYLPVDPEQIPLGRADPVVGTPFDFRAPTPIGAHLRDRHPQLAIAEGYDQYWVLNGRGDGAGPRQAVHVYDPASGRTLDCLTTEPGVGIYTAGFFDGSVAGVGGRYGRYAAFTLETQHAPDSPNHPSFPTTKLRPGQVFDSTTVFRFGVAR